MIYIGRAEKRTEREIKECIERRGKERKRQEGGREKVEGSRKREEDEAKQHVEGRGINKRKHQIQDFTYSSITPMVQMLQNIQWKLKRLA